MDDSPDEAIGHRICADTETPVQAPEVQQMYSLNMPVSAIRTKIRQEFERHRYVAQLPAVDVLIFQSHQEFQVGGPDWNWHGRLRLGPGLDVTGRAG